MYQLHSQLSADTITIGELPLCHVLLMNDAQYPWLILVPRRAGISEIFQLEAQDRQQLELESCALSELLMNHFKGDKLNIGALGNMVPQLHIHHIVRFKADVAWPKPVWGTMPNVPYTQELLKQRFDDLLELLKQIPNFKMS